MVEIKNTRDDIISLNNIEEEKYIVKICQIYRQNKKKLGTNS